MAWGPFDSIQKVAIITGGAMGIGYGIASRFVEAEATVLLADIDESAVFAAAGRLPKDRAAALAVDIAADSAGEQLVSRCVQRFGRVDILVNNAGVYPTVPLLKMSTEQFDRVLKINLRGAALAAKAVALRPIERKSTRRIINISSIDSFQPSMVGLAAYDSSKGGLES